MPQRLTWLDLINPGVVHFAFQMDKLRLLGYRNLNIGLRENRDNISWLQCKILIGLALNGPAQIKRQQVRCKALRIKALNGRIVPVDFGRETFYIVFEFRLAHTKIAGLSIYGKLVLSFPVILGYQEIPLRNEIMDTHAWMPWITPWTGHVAAQSDGVLKPGENSLEAHNIAIVQLAVQPAGIQRKLIRLAQTVILNPLD